jgi:ketosteroid isomerase-like protein
MLPDSKTFANDWIEAWNSHDLERILAHYSDDLELTTPMIRVALNVDSGTLHGKENARHYWRAALQKVPDLRIELIETTQSVGSIAIYYKAVMNKRAIEVMFFNETGEVCRAIAHYT